MIPDEHSSYFSVNSVNGSVHLIKSPDRELTPTLKAKIRVDRLSKKGKSVQMIYPMQPDAFVDLGICLRFWKDMLCFPAKILHCNYFQTYSSK